MYSYHLFLISSISVRSITLLSFIVSIFAWNVPLVLLILLMRSLVFPSLSFSSISLQWSLRKAFLSLLAILWNSAFKWVHLSFSPLLFVSLLFTAICRPPQTAILLLCLLLLEFYAIFIHVYAFVTNIHHLYTNNKHTLCTSWHTCVCYVIIS